MQLPSYKDILKLIIRIPDDPLRPHANLKTVLRPRAYDYIKNTQTERNINQDNLTQNKQELLDQYSALQYLANDKYKLKFPLSEKILHPSENPEYYKKLIESIKPKPPRSSLFKKWFRFGK